MKETQRICTSTSFNRRLIQSRRAAKGQRLAKAWFSTLKLRCFWKKRCWRRCKRARAFGNIFHLFGKQRKAQFYVCLAWVIYVWLEQWQFTSWSLARESGHSRPEQISCCSCWSPGLWTLPIEMWNKRNHRFWFEDSHEKTTYVTFCR